MVTLKEYEAYLKVKRFIDGHDESEIISRLMGDNKYGPLIIKSDDADPIKYSQALHGLAPKFELINMHELIKKSTNNYVTLLPLENGINLNTKGSICKNCKCYVHILMRMRETSSYLKLSLATLCHQEIGSFDASNEGQFYLLSQNDRTLKKYFSLSDLC